jgi:predicted nucleotidyltransferase
MRLTPQTREIIRTTTHEVFGATARVRLFGSRVDDNLRGGDIDLLVELPSHQADSRKKSLALAARLQMRLGDQPIDMTDSASFANDLNLAETYSRMLIETNHRLREDAFARLEIPESRLPSV